MYAKSKPIGLRSSKTRTVKKPRARIVVVKRTVTVVTPRTRPQRLAATRGGRARPRLTLAERSRRSALRLLAQRRLQANLRAVAKLKTFFTRTLVQSAGMLAMLAIFGLGFLGHAQTSGRTYQAAPQTCSGWENPEQAVAIDLLGNEDLANFNGQNSATIASRAEGAAGEPLLKCKGFALPEDFPQDVDIKHIQLNVSLAAMGHPDSVDALVIESSLDGEQWSTLDSFFLTEDTSNAINGGYRTFDFPALNKDNLGSLQVRVRFASVPSDVAVRAFVDGLALTVGVRQVVSAEALNLPKNVVQLEKQNVQTNEEPVVKVEIEKQARLKFLGFKDTKRTVDEVQVTTPEGTVQVASFDIQNVTEGGTTYAKVNIHTDKFTRPGKYTAQVTVLQDNKLAVVSTEFTWGVLVINMNRSVYWPGETVQFGMGVLDPTGHTVCDAKLTLAIVAPDGTKTVQTTEQTEKGVQRSTTCGRDNVTDVADYSAEYETYDEGNYAVTLTAKTASGEYTITDTVIVDAVIPYAISRRGSMRIYPPEAYTMAIDVRPQKAFLGVVEDYVPPSFEILKVSEGGKVIKGQQRTTIRWFVDWKAGTTHTLTYRYDAPDISPEIFRLGPVKVADYQESRQWQIASDAPSTVLDGTEVTATQRAGQHKVVRTTNGSGGVRTFALFYSANEVISLYYSDDPEAGTPTWNSVGTVGTGGNDESADMEWDTTNNVLYITYGRETKADSAASDINYKIVTALNTTPALGTERVALTASASVNFTHPIIEIGADSGNAAILIYATKHTNTGNALSIYLASTQTLNSDNPGFTETANIKTWTAAATSGVISIDRTNGNKTVLFYDNGVDLLATQQLDSADANATASYCDLGGGTCAGTTTISADTMAGKMTGSVYGVPGSDAIWFSWLDSAFDINTRLYNGSTLDTELVPVAGAAVTLGPAIVGTSDTLYMVYQKVSDTTILVYQSRTLTDGTSAWSGTETTLEDHASENLTYPSIGETVNQGFLDVVYTTATNAIVRHMSAQVAVTISGTAYTSHTEGATLNSSGGSISIVNATTGTTASDADGTDGSGVWTMLLKTPTNGDILVLWINGATADGAMVLEYGASCTGTPDCTGLKLYQNNVIVRSEHTGNTISNADLSGCDADSGTGCNDAEIGYTSNSNNLTVSSGYRFFVWTGDTFDPGGTVTTNATGGDFHVDDNAVAYLDTASNVIGLDALVDGGGTLYIDTTTRIEGGDITTSGTSAVVTYTGGQTPTLTIADVGVCDLTDDYIGGGTTPTLSFYNLTTGYGGCGTTNISKTVSVNQTLSVPLQAKLTMAADVSVGVSLTMGDSATVTYSGTPTLTMTGTGNLGSVATSDSLTVYNLTISGTVTTVADTVNVANNVSLTGTLNANTDMIVLGGSIYTVSGGGGTMTYTSGTPTVTLRNTGTLGPISGATGSINMKFYNLTLSYNGTALVTTLRQNVIVDNNLNQTNGASSITYDVSLIPTLVMACVSNGTCTLGSTSSTGITLYNFTSQSTGTVRMGASIIVENAMTVNSGTTFTYTNTPTLTTHGAVSFSMTGATVTFYNLTVGDATTSTLSWSSGTNTIANDLTVNTGSTFTQDTALAVGGNFTNVGTGAIARSGNVTLTMSGSGKTLGGSATGTVSLYAMSVTANAVTIGAASGGVTFANNVNVTAGNQLNINNDLKVGAGLTSGTTGIFTNNGQASTVTFTASGTLGGGNATTCNVYNLTLSGTTTLTQGSNCIANGDVSVPTSTTYTGGTRDLGVYGGQLSGDGALSFTAGTVTIRDSGNLGGATAWTFNNLTLDITGAGADKTTTALGVGGMTINGVLTTTTDATYYTYLNAGSKTWQLKATGAPFVNNGRLTGSTSTFNYSNITSATVGTTTSASNYYHHVTFNPTGLGIPTYTLGEFYADGNVTVGNVSIDPILTGATNNLPFTALGNFSCTIPIENGATVITGTNTWTIGGTLR